MMKRAKNGYSLSGFSGIRIYPPMSSGTARGCAAPHILRPPDRVRSARFLSRSFPLYLPCVKAYGPYGGKAFTPAQVAAVKREQVSQRVYVAAFLQAAGPAAALLKTFHGPRKNI